MRFVPVAARLTFAAALATAIAIFGTACARKTGLIGYPLTHALLSLGSDIGLAALAIGVVWLIGRLVTGNARAAAFGFIGLGLAALVMIAPVETLWHAYTLPVLNDITTDEENPPAFVALLPLRADAENPPAYDGHRKLSYDGEEMTAIEAQKRAYPFVKPLKNFDPEANLYWRAFEAAKRSGWMIAAFDKTRFTIEAFHTDFWTGVTSDIAIRVGKAGLGSRLDVRAKSRNGETDAGTNAALIRAYFKELTGR